MDIDTASKTIEQKLSNDWTLTPVVFENIPAKDLGAEGQPDLYAGTVSFIEIEVSPGFSRPITVPLGCIRYTGFMTAAVMCPRYTGSRESDSIVSALSKMLEFQQLCAGSECLRFKELSVAARSIVKDAWVRTTVQLAFEFNRER